MSHLAGKNLLGLAAALLLVTGCEKVVDLDLKTAAAQLVIEANLADDGQPCRVSLSESANYKETNVFPPVSGAVITLSDDAGHRETLAETRPGQYVGAAVLGVAGHAYTLRVEHNGGAYVAVSTLPGQPTAVPGVFAPVPFEDLHIDKSTFGPNSGLEAVAELTDPPGLGNGYLFRQYRNGQLNKTIFVQNDKFTDGKHVSQALRVMGGANDKNEKLVTGDSVVVEMQNIDPGVYEYYRTLNQILQSNPLFSTTPANPQSNFSGGVLGYFSAHSRQVRRVVVP